MPATQYELKGLREKRAKITADLRALGAKLRADNRAMTSEEREAFARMQADFTAVGDAIRAAEDDLSAIDKVLLTGEDADQGDRRADPGRDDADHRGGAGGRRTRPQPTADERALAFQAWARHQYGMPLRRSHKLALRACGVRAGHKEFVFRLARDPNREYRDQSTTGSAGGYMIPQGFLPEMERALKLYGGVREVCRVLRTQSGQDLPFPTIDDTSNVGELLAENTQHADQDFTFGQIVHKAYKYSSKGMRFSYELLNDEAVNVSGEIGSLLGERIGRAQGVDFTTGNNTGKPQGVVNGAAAGITAASATAIAATEIVRLYHSVDPAYRSGPGVGYMMHDSILAALAILVDSQGRPLFVASFRDGVPDMLYGQRVYINQHMQSTIATGTVTVLFGDFNKYVVRDVGEVRLRRLEERYAEKDQVGFIGFLRSDGRYRQTAAVKKLTQA